MKDSSKKVPRILIMGRPNVGKSTLFNRLLGRKRALVHDMPGVTRDRLIEPAEWVLKRGRFPVKLVDTGGLGEGLFSRQIEQQVLATLQDVDIALVVFDGQTGLVPEDHDVLKFIRKMGLTGRVPVIGIVNKIDLGQHEGRLHDFYGAKLAELMGVSAEHDRGILALKERILELTGVIGNEEQEADQEEELESDDEAGDPARELDEQETNDTLPTQDAEWAKSIEVDEGEELPEVAYERKTPRIAVVGKPNVGKSTFLNALLGEDRMIVSDVAGTTVDSIDSTVRLAGRDYIFIDTAGVRRKNRTEAGVEVLSVVQTKKALERADLAILMIDGEAGPAEQDEKIASMIEDSGCSVIVAVNKWDTQRRTGYTRELAVEHVHREMRFLTYAPILFMSGKRGTGFEDLGPLVDDILEQKYRKISTRELTALVRAETDLRNPGQAKFYLAQHAGRRPPTFVVYVNEPNKVHFSLKRRLVNQVRATWGFMGSPIRMLFVKSKNRLRSDPGAGEGSSSPFRGPKASSGKSRSNKKATRGKKKR